MAAAKVASAFVSVVINVAANRIRASAHSFEAKAFGIVTAGYMDAPMRAVAEVIDQVEIGERLG